MSSPEPFERTLARWMDEEGPQEAPGWIVDAVMRDAQGRSQRRSRAWSWPIVDAVPWGSGAGFRALVVAALLLVALLASMLVVGTIQLRLMDDARDGLIAFESGDEIWLADPAGGTPTRLLRTAGVDESWPVWSPDGRSLAVWVSRGSHAAIHVVDQAGSLLRVLEAPEGLTLPPHQGVFGWSPDGRHLAAPARGSVTEGGVTTLGVEVVVLYEVASGRGEALELDVPAWSFGWSGDGRWLGIVGPDDIYAMRVADRNLHHVAAVARVDDDPGSDPLGAPWKELVPPAFTHDGRAVLFMTNGSIVARDAAAIGLPGSASVGPSRSGPLFLGDRARDTDIRMAPIGGGLTSIVLSGASNDVGPSVARDGRLAVSRSSAPTTSMAFSTGNDLVVVDLNGGDETVVASGVTPGAVWSPGSGRLVARAADGRGFIVVSPSSPLDTTRIAFEGGLGGLSWQATGP